MNVAESRVIRELRSRLGSQLAAYRVAARHTQRSFTERLVGYSRSTVANVETGRQNVPRAFWERCDELLGTGGVLAETYDELQAEIGREQRRQAEAAWAAGTTELPAPVLRALTGASRSTSADLATLDDSTALASEAGSLVSRVDRLLGLFLQLEAELGGDELYEPLARQVGRLARELDTDPRPEAVDAFGRLAQMTGWIAHDANRPAAARRHLSAALYAAHEADDPALAGSALAYMSLQETYLGNQRRARSLAQTAFEVAGDAATPLVSTMLATRLARAHAKHGDRQACDRALGAAEDAFGATASRQEPLWISYVDEVELSAQRGACLLDLGLARPAREALMTALDRLERETPERLRDRVHYLSRLAKCHLLEREVEQACEVADLALHLSTRIGSARVVERLGEFAAALKPFDDQPSARAFQERFTALTPTSGHGSGLRREHRP